jgi:hypothetical protein
MEIMKSLKNRLKNIYELQLQLLSSEQDKSPEKTKPPKYTPRKKKIDVNKKAMKNTFDDYVFG